MDARQVKVVYPDGGEEMGLAVADDVVELGAQAFKLEVHDVLLVDGERRIVLRSQLRMKKRPADAAPESRKADTTVRVRHAPA